MEDKLFVKSLVAGGAAHRCGGLPAGARITAVCGVATTSAETAKGLLGGLAEGEEATVRRAAVELWPGRSRGRRATLTSAPPALTKQLDIDHTEWYDGHVRSSVDKPQPGGKPAPAPSNGAPMRVVQVQPPRKPQPCHPEELRIDNESCARI